MGHNPLTVFYSNTKYFPQINSMRALKVLSLTLGAVVFALSFELKYPIDKTTRRLQAAFNAIFERMRQEGKTQEFTDDDFKEFEKYLAAFEERGIEEIEELQKNNDWDPLSVVVSPSGEIVKHPGEIIRAELLVPSDMTVKEGAESIGLHPVTFSYLLNGQRNLSAKVALRIANKFNKYSAEQLLALQNKYDLAKAQNALTLQPS